MANLTLERKRLLEEGNIIQILPDITFDIEGNRQLVIGGGTFQMKPGIAEYALLTGDAIIPHYSTHRLDGSIHMVFSPPRSKFPPESRFGETKFIRFCSNTRLLWTAVGVWIRKV